MSTEQYSNINSKKKDFSEINLQLVKNKNLLKMTTVQAGLQPAENCQPDFIA